MSKLKAIFVAAALLLVGFWIAPYVVATLNAIIYVVEIFFKILVLCIKYCWIVLAIDIFRRLTMKKKRRRA